MTVNLGRSASIDLVSSTTQTFQDDLRDLLNLTTSGSSGGGSDTSNLTVELATGSAKLQRSGANKDLAAGVHKQYVNATWKKPADDIKNG